MPIPSEQLALIDSALPYARSVARRFARPSVPPEDLAQEAWIALAVAAARFDASRGVTFLTYANPFLRSAFTHLSRTTAHAVTIPKDAYLAAVDANRHDNSADGTGAAAQTAMTPGVSLDAAAPGGTATLADVLVADSEPFEDAIDARLDAEARRSDAQLHVAKLIQLLPTQERFVVEATFGLPGAPCGATQKEIAAYLGATQGAISKVLRRALKRMHEAAPVRNILA